MRAGAVRSSPNLSAREPVPAFVPAPRERAAPRSTDELTETVRVGERPPTPVLAQYRRLARGLQRMQGERGLNRLLVTSALPGDGRTSTATNAAVALSDRFDRRVLLIDADVRRPAVHESFGLTSRSGLTDVLMGNCRDLPILDVSKNLCVLPGGRPNPEAIALLTSDRMEWLISQCASHFDWILVDGPPVSSMPDPQLLARMTGAVLFVIGAGSTPHRVVRRALDALGADCVVGTVLSRVRPERVMAMPTSIESAEPIELSGSDGGTGAGVTTVKPQGLTWR